MDFNRDLYADADGVTHVIEARLTGEWQFSDGPPGERGASTDYFDLAEGLRDFAGRKLVFHYDEPADDPEFGADGYQFHVTLSYDTAAKNAAEAIGVAVAAAGMGHVHATVYRGDRMLGEYEDAMVMQALALS